MSRQALLSLYDIQLFAEGGDAQGSGGNGPAGQEAAAFAQPRQTGVNPAASPAGESRGQAPDAGERQQEAGDRAARFEALIKGEFKDLYDRRVQDTVRRRLKNSEETAKRLDTLSPALELLEKRYGVDAGDAPALARAIEAECAAEGREQPKAPEPEERGEALRRELARRQLAAWTRQAEETRLRYPSFDLREEARDPRFRSLIGSGVPLRTAFEVLHQREILPAAMAYSARRAEEKLADSVIAGQLRPAEGALGGQSPVLSKRDVTQLTRAEREEIDRRVARGEKIRF